MFRFLSLGFAAIAVVFGSAADETSTIELGGLRQAKAVLTITKDEYLVKVQMLPIQCFDVPMNARLNREKARELALQGLAKHLSQKEAVQFTVSGVQIVNAGNEAKLYTLNLKVPRNGITVAQEGKKPNVKKGEDWVPFTGDLFSRKREYLDTLAKLMASVDLDVEKAEEMPRASFDHAKTEIEQRALKNLESLGSEINNDLLLFSIDQKELHEAIARARMRMLIQLKEAVKRQEAKEKSP